VIADEKGAYLVMAEDRRDSGDLTFEQKKMDLARELAKKQWGQEAAKRAAVKALADAGGKTLDKLYRQGPPSRYQPPVKLRQTLKAVLAKLRSKDSKDLSEQERQQLNMEGAIAQQLLMEDRANIVGKDEPTAKADVTPSKDDVPNVDVALEVTLQGPAPRMWVMPGIGPSKEASNALFDELGPNKLASKVYQAGENYYLIQLVDKTQPKADDFDKEAAEVIAELREARAAQAVESWLRNQCETLAKENKIKVNPDLVRETDDKGNVRPTQYSPCQSFRAQSNVVME
jgi:hypothetical protein